MESILDQLLNNPLIVGPLISLLMICDSWLTRHGYRLLHQGYHEKITIEIYELNPRFQKIFHENLPLPKSHYVFVIGIGVLSTIIVFISPPTLDPLVETALGAALLGLTLINLRHLENIGNFNYVKKNPTCLQGNVTMRADYIHIKASNRELRNGILIFFIFLLVNRVFFLGGAIIALIIAILDTSRGKKRRKEAQQTSSESASAI